jgi:hypothetical protein
MSGTDCSSCGQSVPTLNLGFPLAIYDETPAVRGLPPPPRPLTPILLSTSHDPGADVPPGLFDRCRHCQARILPTADRCLTCGTEREAPDCEEARDGLRGPMRRDYESHRGPLLLWLGRGALFLSFPGWLGIAVWVFSIAGVIAVVLAAMVILWSREDLVRMREGTMDPDGKAATESAQGFAAGGLAIALLGLLMFVLSRLPMLLGDWP